MTSYDDSLLQLQQKAARKKQLEAKLNELRDQRRVFDKKVSQLRVEHRSEQADVDKLEGRSLARYFCQITGKLEEKLDEERRQVAAAKVKLDAAQRELTSVDCEIQKIQSQLQALAGCEEAYAAALESKRNAVKASGTPDASQILEMEERIAFLESQKKEIREAVSAGRRALEMADSVLSELEDADGWNTWDMIGGGGILTHMAKHSHLDDAQEKVEQLQDQLRRFKTELADISVRADMQVNIDGFLRFADYFFDGLFADWAVGDKISESQASVRNVKSQIDSALSKLSSMDAAADRKIATLKSRIEARIVEA